MNRSRTFSFDGTAGTYFESWLIGWLLTLVTFGIAYPWAFCRLQRWKTEHTGVEGRRLVFTGTGGDLFGYSLKWFILSALTIGIYTFWAVPEFNKWITEHTDFEPLPFIPNPLMEQPDAPQEPQATTAADDIGRARDMEPVV